MTDENTTMTAEDYITALGEVKANSVDKSEYERVLAENTKLTNALASGIRKEEPEVEEVVNPADIIKRMAENKYKNNLEYCSDVVKLRETIMQTTGSDPCVNYSGEDVSAEINRSERVFELFNSAIEEAEGDPVKFDAIIKSKVQFPVGKK